MPETTTPAANSEQATIRSSFSLRLSYWPGMSITAFVRGINEIAGPRFPARGAGTRRLRAQSPRSVRGADFPGGVADAGQVLEISGHCIQLVWIDGARDQLCHDLDQIIPGFAHFDSGHQIFCALELLNEPVTHV